MRKRTVEIINATQSPANAEDLSADRDTPAGILAKAARPAQSPWPFNLSDVTPLEWWRTMPADHLADVQHLHLRATMEKICVMKDRQWLAALQADAAASIAIALGAMPIDQMTLEVDLAMSALVLCALEGSAGAAAVLAHILRRTALDHPFGKDLAASWLALNLCRALNAKGHAAEPHLRSKMSNASRRRHTSAFTPVPA